MLGIERWANVEALADEASTTLGDQRRFQRQQSLLVAMGRNPGLSFPRALEPGRSLQAFYRLIRAKGVSWPAMIAGHIDSTRQRCAKVGPLLVLHDTTSVTVPLRDPDQARDNLSRPTTKTQGFHAHVSIAVTAGEQALPLGTLAFQPFVHRKDLEQDGAEAFWTEQGGLYDNERKRWFDAIERSDDLLGGPGRAVHVMDREGDSFPMISWLQHRGSRFVQRVNVTNRRLKSNGSISHLDELLADVPFSATCQAELSARSPLRRPREMKTFPARKARTAKLHVRALSITLAPAPSPPPYCPADFKLSRETTVNLVEIIERNPPADAEPVRWLLFTSEPIETAAEMLAVVEIYRRRWLIEEFFKALKTGCKLEERQMNSASTMLNVMVMLMPVAWHLLLVRSLDRFFPDLPWESVLPPLTFRILRHKQSRAALHEKSTARDVLRAIASLGGHLKSNGPPGWLTLHRGMAVLLDLERGYLIYEEMHVLRDA